MKRKLSSLGIPTLTLCLCYAACLVRGSAETKNSILESFKGYVANKIQTTKPADGIVCSSPGKSPKSAACFDKVGKQNCLAKKKYFDKLAEAKIEHEKKLSEWYQKQKQQLPSESVADGSADDVEKSDLD